MVVHLEYPLETERLRLRPFTRGDVDAVFAYRQREEVARYLFDPPLSRDDCAEAVQQRVSQTCIEQDGDKIVLAVDRRDTGELAGEISLIARSLEARQGEIGWVLSPDHQGQGYATEAARAILAIGFGPAQMHRVMARCNARNFASVKLMERLGMRREAHLREHGLFKGDWDEEFIYALLEDEWRAQSTQ